MQNNSLYFNAQTVPEISVVLDNNPIYKQENTKNYKCFIQKNIFFKDNINFLNFSKEDDTAESLKIYLNSIKNISLLSVHEEKDLIKKIYENNKILSQGLLFNKKILRKAQKNNIKLRNRLVRANLRLVVTIAKHYCELGLPLLDLIQEGNIGLIKAAEKFDYTIGNRFITYAILWIKQVIIRALYSKTRNIRLPVHINEAIVEIKKAKNKLVIELGRYPDDDEIANITNVPVAKIKYLKTISKNVISLDSPVDDEKNLGDSIEGQDSEYFVDTLINKTLSQDIHGILNTLTFREQKIIALRYGLDDNQPQSLADIGAQIGLTRQRIKQIETEALKKLKYHAQKKYLNEYLH